MRHGSMNGKMVVSNSGRIIGFATGSDFCTEHECGTKQLQEDLTVQGDHLDEKVIEKLRKSPSFLDRLCGKTEIEFPRLLDRKMINQNLDRIKFVELPGPEAYLGYTGYREKDLTSYERELSFYKDENFAGAWDKSSFAVRVRGKSYVKKLKDFYEQMKAGKVCFAGTFAKEDKGETLGGLCLMVVDRLREEYIANIEKAQAEYESNLRLKAASLADELNRIMFSTPDRGFTGHIWPIWKDKHESDVIYGFNPGHKVKAQYYGPYTFTELKAWLEGGCAYYLTPKEAKTAA